MLYTFVKHPAEGGTKLAQVEIDCISTAAVTEIIRPILKGGILHSHIRVGAREPHLLDIAQARNWAAATVRILGEKFDASFIDCQRMAEIADMFHSACCLG